MIAKKRIFFGVITHFSNFTIKFNFSLGKDPPGHILESLFDSIVDEEIRFDQEGEVFGNAEVIIILIF